MIKIAHISDIHWRSLKRHEEYRQVFKSVFESLKLQKPDAIFIGGDIVHSKTQGITPELIDNLTWMFNEFAKISDVHVILGNHDGLILNKDRQDAVTPIINALDNPKIKLYKKSGVYPLFKAVNGQMINWCVFSCFDEENWDKVKPVDNEINIACFHGAVRGSKTDVDWELEGEVNLSFFDGFDFGFLGDIHKKQFLDNEQRIAYPGSLIQQNYGEDISKGYFLWEINSRYDYKTEFVKIKNSHPFVTIDWKDSIEKTIRFCEKLKNNTRIRVRSQLEISQAEIKILHHYLKNDKKANEIVYQVLNKISDQFSFDKNLQSKNFNIRNKENRKSLINDLYPEISESEFEALNSLFNEKIKEIPETLSTDKNNWSINSLEFDNTFSYGKSNFINFNNLKGVVGLFGNNRIGKSSIAGTLMYTLFNTTDRGTIKNQDIVNIRKGYCESKACITVNDKEYLVTRKTTKKTNKKGITSSSTNLELIRKDIVSDETEEQRRETDKVLKELIGTPEDFLYTSFASQGEMNAFINEKSSARKSILANFLSLDVFDKLYKNSREDYIVLKNKLKNVKDENWDLLINNIENNISVLDADIAENNKKLSAQRMNQIDLNVKISSLKKEINNHSSGYSLETCQKEIDYLTEKTSSLTSLINDMNLKVKENYLNLEKINNFKSAYPIDDLTNDKNKLDIMLEKIKNFKFEKRKLDHKKEEIDNEIKILDQVPCGDKFPTCKFIEKAYKSKTQKNDLSEGIETIKTSILELNNVINKLQSQNISEKIDKYNNILNKEYRINVDIERLKEKVLFKESEYNENSLKLENLQKILLEIKSLNNNNLIKEVEKHKTELNNVQNNILLLERENKQKDIEKFSLIHEINALKLRKEEYKKVVFDWKIYDLFTLAVSKKGIPAMIINSCLPKINNEINNILNGVVSFKIEVAEDFKNNSLNVYIDYGDSKRVIECASGMEKMIASIAIRVALINISSISKSNIFIIDEGFGSLDSTNIESCARLLKSLKKYFKTILIISHVDEIKDIVDKNLEISKKGQDSYVEFR